MAIGPSNLVMHVSTCSMVLLSSVNILSGMFELQDNDWEDYCSITVVLNEEPDRHSRYMRSQHARGGNQCVPPAEAG